MKPCPFCGSEDIIFRVTESYYSEWYEPVIECPCGVSLRGEDESRKSKALAQAKELRARWDKRV